MLADAFKWLKEFFDSAARPQLIKNPANEHETFMYLPNGDLKPYLADVPALRVTDTLRGFFDLLDQLGSHKPHAVPLAIYVRPDHLTAYLDEPYRKHEIRCALKHTQAYLALQSLAITFDAEPKKFTQDKLVTFFRDTLEGLVPKTTVDLFAHINWAAEDRVKVMTQNANRSIDADIVRKASGGATGTETLPEQINVRVPVFTTDELSGFEVSLVLEVRCDPNTKTFALWLNREVSHQADREILDAVLTRCQEVSGSQIADPQPYVFIPGRVK